MADSTPLVQNHPLNIRSNTNHTTLTMPRRCKIASGLCGGRSERTQIIIEAAPDRDVTAVGGWVNEGLLAQIAKTAVFLANGKIAVPLSLNP